MVNVPQSIADFLQDGRRCKKALFTTYALSLTFFETYILPKLRQTGCEQIWILVDADGYRASLMELRSRFIGQSYALIPIQLNSGIFHSKITYLWGEKEDLLLVGSGNLTFGGHGRNVEVLEALHPNQDATAFRDFADFLLGLTKRAGLSLPDADFLSMFIDRAESQAAKGKDDGRTRLIHSVSTPILDQLLAQAQQQVGWSELLVLSPFHHPDGGPVRKLAEGLGVSRLTVGVSSSRHETSSFPFDKAESWGLDLQVVAPNVDKPNRPLHAKWFELRGERVWAMTGSVNATEQSLASTRNIEAGIIRSLDAPTRECWKSVDRPAYCPDEIVQGNDRADAVIYAVLDGSGTLKGRIIGKADSARVWEGSLTVSDEVLETAGIEIETDGDFHWKLQKNYEFQVVNAMQIRLVRGEHVARGWVNLPALLDLPAQSRSALNALSRMLSRSESPDDIQALLDYIAIHTGRVVEAALRPGAQPAHVGNHPPEDFEFRIGELLASRHKAESELFKELTSPEIEKGDSWKALHMVAQLLLGRKSGLASPPKSGLESALGDGGGFIEDPDDEREVRQKETALEAFNEAIRSALDQLKPGEHQLVDILFTWGNVNLDMLLRRLDDRATAIHFAEEWMQRVIRAAIPVQQKALIDEMVFGITAILAWNVRDRQQDVAGMYRSAGTMQSIHQWLEAYIGGTVNAEDAINMAESWLGHETPGLLLDGAQQDALDALAASLAERTLRSVLEVIVANQERGEASSIPEGMFNAEEEAWIRTIMRTPPGLRTYRVVNHHTVKACPKCFVRLIKDTLARLSGRHIAQCVHCNCILVSLVP